MSKAFNNKFISWKSIFRGTLALNNNLNNHVLLYRHNHNESNGLNFDSFINIEHKKIFPRNVQEDYLSNTFFIKFL